jgi:hypothetical protein
MVYISENRNILLYNLYELSCCLCIIRFENLCVSCCVIYPTFSRVKRFACTQRYFDKLGCKYFHTCSRMSYIFLQRAIEAHTEHASDQILSGKKVRIEEEYRAQPTGTIGLIHEHTPQSARINYS